jgi:hypothetical protein
MRQWIRVKVDSALPSLRFFVTLLVMAASFLVWMSVMGCGECDNPAPPTRYYSSPMASKASAPAPTIQGKIQSDQTSVEAGERVQRTFTTQSLSAEAPGQVTYTWTPPAGATNFGWTDGQAPSNPNGPPPFVWPNVPAIVKIVVDCTMPQAPAGQESTKVTETLTTEYEGGNPSHEELTTTIWSHGGDEQVADAARGAQIPARLGAETTTQNIQVWATDHWYDPRGTPLTSETCQTALDFLMSDRVFFAVQAPVTSSGPITESQSLSLVMGEYNPGTLDIQIWGQGSPAHSVELETRHERATFMTNALPAEGGKAWVALGAPDDAPTCPAHLNAAADAWSVRSSISLDLRTLPNGGEGSHITSYMCYEGQDSPVVDAVAATLARRAGVGLASYQGEGITCLGPQITYFHENAAWQLEGSSHETATVAEPITFHHAVLRISGPGLSLNYAITSTLDVEWGLYYGSDTQPNLGQPAPNPMPMSGTFTNIWLVSEEVSAETPAGPYSALLTLTNAATPADVRIASNTIWVGDWVAPPAPPKNPFLPLIVR